MIFIKCIGALFVLVGALVISGAYSRYYTKSVEECKQLLSFIREIREDISSFLLPQSKLGKRASRYPCDGNPFFSALARGQTLADAYEESADRMNVPEGFKRVLSELFSRLGRSYASEEAARIDSAVASLQQELNELEERAIKDVKCARTVILAVALGAVILLL